MPDPAGTKNDGGVVFGSQVLTIPNRSNATTHYIAESFTLEAGSDFLVRNNEVGIPNGQVGRETVPTGSAVLQLEDDEVLLPKLFAEFTAKEVGGTNVTLIVSKVGQAFDAGGETKVPIDVRAKLS